LAELGDVTVGSGLKGKKRQLGIFAAKWLQSRLFGHKHTNKKARLLASLLATGPDGWPKAHAALHAAGEIEVPETDQKQEIASKICRGRFITGT